MKRDTEEMRLVFPLSTKERNTAENLGKRKNLSDFHYVGSKSYRKEITLKKTKTNNNDNEQFV